jgi:hypothetical protein
MYAEQLRKSGLDPANNPEHFRALAEWINTSTGRGSYGSLNCYAPTASALLFAPRLVKSRFDMLNPVRYAKMPKEVRVMAMKDMIKFVGATTALLTLAKMGGASVSLDPRSSDFGKIKIGNTRIDPWGGFAQVAKFIAQVSSGQRVDAWVLRMRAIAQPVDERAAHLLGLLAQLDAFARVVQPVVDGLRGSTVVGRPGAVRLRQRGQVGSGQGQVQLVVQPAEHAHAARSVTMIGRSRAASTRRASASGRSGLIR